MLVVKTILFGILIPGTVAGLVPYYLVRDAPPFVWDFQRVSHWFGAILALAGAALAARCAADFVWSGEGTPAPIDPPKKLVTVGFYRYSRNPMYVGIVSLLMGEAVLFRSPNLWIYTALVVVGFHLYAIFYEEPNLRRRFGESYLEYCRMVPRWIWPKRSIGRAPNHEKLP